ncbi:MAG: 50S ribosomal protein L32 [Leptospiraceae bacterium]|nr:50S ribosomal protein L32 [Leptospiraceae bacterium]
MAVPKRKTSLQRKRSRRAHHALGRPHLVPCKNCGTFVRSHRMCPECGWYKDRVVIAPKARSSSAD